MSMLKIAISREEVRNEKMIAEYTKELEKLPKGKITPKVINGKSYYYLYFRDGEKIISKYIGKDENDLIILREQLDRRNQVEEIIKKLKEERTKIKKLEAML